MCINKPSGVTCRRYFSKAWSKEPVHSQANKDFVQLPTAFEQTGGKKVAYSEPSASLLHTPQSLKSWYFQIINNICIK